MVLESLNNLNIKRMVLETPERSEELPFDVERDITHEDWSRMRRTLKYFMDHNWSNLDFHAVAMKFVDPNVELNLSQRALENVEENFKMYKGSDGLFMFADRAVKAKILCPNLNLNLDKKSWMGMFQQLEEFRNKSEWIEFARQALYIKILDPSMILSLDKEAWDGMKEKLEELRNDDRGSQWSHSVWLAMNMKILDSKVDLNLNKEIWDKMMQELEKSRGDGETSGESLAWKIAEVKILAAEEVRVTDKGLELIMPKPKIKPVKDIPPMPETKKF